MRDKIKDKQYFEDLLKEEEKNIKKEEQESNKETEDAETFDFDWLCDTEKKDEEGAKIDYSVIESNGFLTLSLRQLYKYFVKDEMIEKSEIIEVIDASCRDGDDPVQNLVNIFVKNYDFETLKEWREQVKKDYDSLCENDLLVNLNSKFIIWQALTNIMEMSLAEIKKLKNGQI